MNNFKYFLLNKYHKYDLVMRGGCTTEKTNIPICINENNDIQIKNHPKVFIFDKKNDIENFSTSSISPNDTTPEIEIIKTKCKVYKYTRPNFKYIHPLLKKIGIKVQPAKETHAKATHAGVITPNKYIFNIYNHGIFGYNDKESKTDILHNVATHKYEQIPYTQNNMAFIDAANCDSLRKSLGVMGISAGGVSGAIYNKLKGYKWVYGTTIPTQDSCVPGFAQLRIYNKKNTDKINIFHTVGPNSISQNNIKNKLNDLYLVYKNLFLQYIKHLRDESRNKIFVLRLLPISSELFGGYKYDKFSELTFAIILAAFNDLKRDDQLLFLEKCKLIEFCLFKDIYTRDQYSVNYSDKFTTLHTKYRDQQFNLTDITSEIEI